MILEYANDSCGLGMVGIYCKVLTEISSLIVTKFNLLLLVQKNNGISHHHSLNHHAASNVNLSFEMKINIQTYWTLQIISGRYASAIHKLSRDYERITHTTN